jgi:hypothetical protein
MVVMLPHSRALLLDRESPIGATAAWVEHVLKRPHPACGTRAICPALIGATGTDSLYYVQLNGAIEALPGTVRLWLERFDAPTPRGIGSQPDAIILVGETENQRGAMQQVHTSLKPEFVSQGLMLGTFNPDERGEPANADGWPPRSPHPVLAIRRMIRTDLRFLRSPQFRTQFADRFKL